MYSIRNRLDTLKFAGLMYLASLMSLKSVNRQRKTSLKSTKSRCNEKVWLSYARSPVNGFEYAETGIHACKRPRPTLITVVPAGDLEVVARIWYTYLCFHKHYLLKVLKWLTRAIFHCGAARRRCYRNGRISPLNRLRGLALMIPRKSHLCDVVHIVLRSVVRRNGPQSHWSLTVA